jgi:trans-2,3-dihydro-3-hydroxyanthranilate isomerase
MPASDRAPAALAYHQVDVFAAAPYVGNGLAVFPAEGGLTVRQMQTIAQELRQFESIFLARVGEGNEVRARIFTVEEELPFAGHPILGASAVLHHEHRRTEDQSAWLFRLAARDVRVTSWLMPHGYRARMEQGTAHFSPPLKRKEEAAFLKALGLTGNDRHPDLPLQTVSTGLPYLILPVRGGIDRARIRHPTFEALLASVGAKFVYVLDPDAPEGRTWDNAGLQEDVATGSAAGPAGAYLVQHAGRPAEESFTIRQGARAGRPCELHVLVRREGQSLLVDVEGDIVLIGQGHLTRLPPA